MIIGAITLMTMLFFGGVQEYLFIDKLEKGVKQIITDKERSKEILADLRTSESIINTFTKDRKSKLKQFHQLNLDRNTSLTTLEDFFDKRIEERLVFQDKLLDDRMKITAKIHDEEWDQIIALSDESVEKIVSTEEKKKQIDAFESVYNTINKSISENERMVQATALVQNFQTRYQEIESKISSINTKENDLLRDKNTNKSQFVSLAKEINNIRATSYKAFIDFHFDMKEVAEETEWAGIMKAMNKVIQ